MFVVFDVFEIGFDYYMVIDCEWFYFLIFFVC